MSTFETIIVIVLLVILLSVIWLLTDFSTLKRELQETKKSTDPDTLKLRLQAYERITLVAERIGLQNVLSIID